MRFDAELLFDDGTTEMSGAGAQVSDNVIDLGSSEGTGATRGLRVVSLCTVDFNVASDVTVEVWHDDNAAMSSATLLVSGPVNASPVAGDVMLDVELPAVHERYLRVTHNYTGTEDEAIAYTGITTATNDSFPTS